MSEKSLIVHGKSVPSAYPDPSQKEGRGRQVDHSLEPELAVHRLEAGDPETSGFVVPLGLLALVALQVVVLVIGARLLPVTVMRLVVEDEDVLQPHQLRHRPLEHLPLGLQRVEIVPDAPPEQRAPAL
jgi:hypothetical protein